MRLVLTVLLFIAQATVPVPRRAAKNHSEKADTETQVPKDSQKTANPIPFNAPVEVSTGENSTAAGTNNQTQNAGPSATKNESWSRADKLSLAYDILTGLLAVIGGVGVCYALRTLRAVERQVHEMRLQRRHIARQAQSMRYQTTHLKNSVIQARKAANAAKASAEALINSERAWVIVHAELTHDMGQFFIRPTVTNLGKTIARIRKISLSGTAIQVGKQLPDIPAYQTSVDYDFILCPQQEFPKEEIPRISVGGENIPSFNQGVLVLYFYGLVEYLDLAGRKRETGFVLVYRQMRFLPHLAAPVAYYKAT